MNRQDRIRSIYTLTHRAELPSTLACHDALDNVAREPHRIVRPPPDSNPTKGPGSTRRSAHWRNCPNS